MRLPYRQAPHTSLSEGSIYYNHQGVKGIGYIHELFYIEGNARLLQMCSNGIHNRTANKGCHRAPSHILDILF
jgi:hypothetical protein